MAEELEFNEELVEEELTDEEEIEDIESGIVLTVGGKENAAVLRNEYR